MPYVVEKVPGGYKVCKDRKTLKDKKDCFSKLPLSSYNVREQQKALYAAEHGPRSNANPRGTKFNVQVGQAIKTFGTAKQIAPFVSQLTGVGASQIIDRLKSGAFHSFGNDVTVYVQSKYRGEGVLDWLTKKVGDTFFKSSTPQGTPANVTSATSQIKASFPADTKTLYEMNKNAYANSCNDVNGWECVSGTKLTQFYKKANNIIVVVRGTASLQDLMADIKIAFQNVTGSSRFKEDVAAIQAFQQQYPPSQYNYYFTGHSLGGALIDEYLKLGLGTSAISFNPAVQKEFYNTFNHHRIYNTQDPLYDLMGKHVPSAEVRDYKGPQEQSFMSKFIGAIPIVGDATKALKGHSLDNYIGGRMIVPSVIDRPYMRGAGPGLYGGGWLDDFGKAIVRIAMPAVTLGAISGDDALKGDLNPKFDNILPYVVKTGSNLLDAKSGDPSGLIEQATGGSNDPKPKKRIAPTLLTNVADIAKATEKTLQENSAAARYRQNVENLASRYLTEEEKKQMTDLPESVFQEKYKQLPRVQSMNEYFADFEKRLKEKETAEKEAQRKKIAERKAMTPCEQKRAKLIKSGEDFVKNCKKDQKGTFLKIAEKENPLFIYRRKKRTVESGSGQRCRWVDKGTRYPDWQEVCDGGGLYYDNPKYGRIYCANCD